ncbi:hypothetical protein EC988_000639 [Linderina pennispora]|nr:hypothetical protein EC988_000639 [Linderina pennispora]
MVPVDEQLPIEQAVTNAQRILHEQLLRGLSLQNTGFTLTQRILDDTYCIDPGYSFIDDRRNGFQDYSTVLYTHLEATGYFTANALTTARDWLGFAGAFIDELHNSIRGISTSVIPDMALANLRIRNANGIKRNLFYSMQSAELRFCGTGGVCLPSVYLPPPLTNLLLVYLVFVRPVERRMALELTNDAGGSREGDSQTAFEAYLFVKDSRRTLIIP